MKRHFFSIVTLLFVLSVVPVHPVDAQSPGGGERSFSVHVPFTGIVVGGKTKAELDVTFRNVADSDNVVSISLEGFEESGLEARIVNTRWSGYGVNRIRLGAEEPHHEAKVTLLLSAKEGAQPGVYDGLLTASSEVRGDSARIPLSVRLETDEIVPADEVLKAGTAYPVVENPAGSAFTYEIDLKNNSAESVVVDFTLSVPPGWSSSISPRWESGRRIQSIRMDGNKSEKLNLTVTPPSRVAAGEYPVAFSARSGDEEVTLDLKAVVTGTFSLKILPESQRLNFDTVAGTETIVPIYVWNDGTAAVQNVRFRTSKPDEWEVSFEPETIESLAPLSSAGRPEVVNLKVKAPSRSIPGDYQIVLTASGNESDDRITLRATVKVPTAWGWVGIGVIAAVLALLFGTFWKLKRR